MSSFDKSADLEGHVRAISIAVLFERHLRESMGRVEPHGIFILTQNDDVF